MLKLEKNVEIKFIGIQKKLLICYYFPISASLKIVSGLLINVITERVITIWKWLPFVRQTVMSGLMLNVYHA